MSWLLNQKALVRLRALVKAGKYIDRAWSFSAKDSDDMLGPGENWTDYGMNFLGKDAQGNTDGKAYWSFPYGKDGMVNLAALRAIISAATKQGCMDIAREATDALADANARDKDRDKASGQACDLPVEITCGGKIDIQAEAAGGSGPPKISMVGYTGTPMVLKGWDQPVVIDQQGWQDLDKPHAILRDHDQGKVVGHGQARLEGSNLVSDGVASGSGPHVDEVVNSSKNNFPWQASVGARVLKKEFVPKGQSAAANGRDWDGPLYIARAARLGEISFVAIGADDSTSARIAAQAAKGKAMKFKAWAAAHGIKCDDMSAAQKVTALATFKAAYPDGEDDSDSGDDGDKKDGAKPAKSAAVLDIQASGAGTGGGNSDGGKKAAAADALRTRKVRRLFDSLDIKAMQLDDKTAATITNELDQIEASAFESEKPFEDIKNQVDLIVLRAGRAPKPGVVGKNVYANVGSYSLDVVAQANPEIAAAVMSGSLAISGGVDEEHALAGLDDKQKELATSKNNRNMGLHQAMYTIACAAGIPHTPGRMDDEFLRAMLFHDDEMAREISRRHDVQAAGGSFSTMSLSGLLENILNKMLLMSYDMAESVVDDICWNRDTNDFKPFKSYRMTAAGQMQLVGENGEVKNVGLGDETYQNQVTTQGALLVITREKIMNDDMSAITQAPQSLMELAMVAREKAVFTTLYSGLSTTAPGASIGKAANAFNFISTGAKNTQTGGGSALSTTSLAVARKQFRQQKDANGNPIMFMPDRLLVGSALETTADNLFSGANLIANALGLPSASSGTAAAQTGTQIPDLNAFKNKYRPVVSPWFDSGSPVAGMTDTQWALLGNPGGGKAALQIGYLRGQKTPIIQRGETNFNTLGIYLRCIYDFGVALHDYRCIQYSAGA